MQVVVESNSMVSLILFILE